MRLLWIARHGILFLWWIAIYRATGRFDVEKNTLQVRRFLEGMGGVWVKAGQLIAMRRDLFSDRFCDILSALQDHSTGFPPEVAVAIIEEELGMSIAEAFLEFEPKPFAAASIGQLHAARLPDGVRVAVKVMRPNIAKVFERDMRVVRLIIGTIQRMGFTPHLRWSDFLWELEGTLGDELDYRLEATNLRRMRKKLKRHRVYVPRPFLKYCGRRILTMEFIQGVFMSDYLRVLREDPIRLQSWLDENDVDPVRVGERLYFTHVRQLFEDHLFHCDLHPGNILITKKGRLALIDFGSVGTVEAALLRKYRMLTESIATHDHTRTADLFLLLVPSLPEGVDTQSVKEKIVRWMRHWEIRSATRELPYHEKSFAFAVGGITRIMMEHKVPVTWEFMRINRAGVTLDASLMFLMPKVNYPRLARRYLARAEQRELAKLGRRRQRSLTLAQTVKAMNELPHAVSEYIFFEGEWLRRRAKTFQLTTSKFAYLVQVAAQLVATVMLVSVFVAVNVGLRHFGYQPWKAIFGEWLGGEIDTLLSSVQPDSPTLLLVLLPAGLYVLFLFRRLRARFSLKEFDRSPTH